LRKFSIDVKRKSGEDFAELSITVPAGRVRGAVVDASGAPARASIVVFDADVRHVIATTSTDDAGRFDLAGLKPEDIQLSAENSQGESGFVAHTVVEDDDREVTLTLRSKRVFHGRILAPSSAPIAGAIVRYTLNGLRHDLVTGPEGDFRVKTATVEPLRLAILAAGFPVKLMTVTTFNDDVQPIMLGPAAALLHIRFQQMPYITHGGAMTRLDALLFPTDGGPPPEYVDDGLLIELDPGLYLICPASAVSPDCVQRMLAAGAREQVDLRGAS
jgi:hypothetical protein